MRQLEQRQVPICDAGFYVPKETLSPGDELNVHMAQVLETSSLPG